MSIKVIRINNDPIPDWKIHKVSKESVYPKGIFNFKNKYSVQTTAGDISSTNEKISIPLLDPHAIAKHKQKYRYVHIGLLQVYVTPLMFRGINGSISLFLKDKRLFDFSDTFLNVPQAIHYKWMRDQVNPAAKSYGPGIEIVFRQRNMISPKDLTPKTIKRSDLEFPEGWDVQDENPEEQEHNSPRFVHISSMNVKLEFPRK
ncbi:hypothetical protein JRO89_XS05G0252000 [Xanthoceras sorbifolium]|uniref:Uncharacterized protein n=1 Tax=Xanthoceras sorbifolium TaxID=99658 RepID=A0ABQ8I3C2_9ROSI|nr:hypothetical protein JRO89_XS05G0252000 [Xanthoceras sorbifolium]